VQRCVEVHDDRVAWRDVDHEVPNLTQVARPQPRRRARTVPAEPIQRESGDVDGAIGSHDVVRRGSQPNDGDTAAYALAGAVTAGRSTRQSGIVASTTIATMLSVIGTPVRSPMKPQMVGASAEAAIVVV